MRTALLLTAAVLATAPATSSADYYFRARPLAIEATAPMPPPGAPEWAAGVMILRPGRTYVTGRGYDAIIRDGASAIDRLFAARIASLRNDSLTTASAAYLSTYNWRLGAGYMSRSMDERLSPFGVRVAQRGDGFALRVGAGTPGIWLTTASPAGEELLRLLDLRESAP